MGWTGSDRGQSDEHGSGLGNHLGLELERRAAASRGREPGKPRSRRYAFAARQAGAPHTRRNSEFCTGK